MTSIVFLFCVVFVPASCSLLIAEGRDRFLLFCVICFAGIFFLSGLSLINDVIPFTDGGDDDTYLKVSKRTFDNPSDWFDLTQFKRTHDQAGYPLLLSWIHQIVGESLFHRKALNVFFFLLLTITWFKIGNVIGGRRLAFVYASGILLMTPFWFYWIFLLKDMTLTLLQSVFIMGLVLFLSKDFRLQSYFWLCLSTVGTLPFRSMLALSNLAVMTCSTFLQPGPPNTKLAFLGKTTAVATIMAFVLIIGSQPEYLKLLGVGSDHRSLDYESVQKTLDIYKENRVSSIGSIMKFPLVYLVGEVAAFNPKSWDGMSSTLIRSVAMLPWIYFGLPLFLLGTWKTFRRFKENKSIESENVGLSESTASEVVPRPYLWLFLIFVSMYGGIAWLTGDTTRWTLSSYPTMVGIAGYAWISMNNSKQFALLFGWSLILSISLIIYYVVLK